jgi:formylglycine-generating enzyme required for sulfatase activity
MICVPGGPFVRGFDGEHSCDEYEVKWSRTNHNPAAEVWLSSYFLDREEVTYAAYQRCVEHGRCPPRVPNYVDFRRAALPMTGVSWFEARAYCEAQGKRLPTEAEFERAARGTEGRLHPWGDEPADCARAVIMDESGRGCGTPKAGSHPEKGRPLDVGSRPAIDGFTDLIGNAEEWVADWYLPYGECGDACLGTDPEGPCAGADTCAASKTRVVKGGSWYWGPACATGANRRHHFPKNSPYHHFGFRCAASLDAAALARPPEPRPEEAP